MLVRSVVLLRAAAAFGLALGLPLVAVAQERGRLFFDPDHLGIERAVPKAYNVRLLPPPTGNVEVALSLGECAEVVEASPSTLLYTPHPADMPLWHEVTLTAKKREDADDEGADPGGREEEEETGPCATFEVLHRVTTTADPRFRGVRALLPVEITKNRAPRVVAPIRNQELDPWAQATFALDQAFYEPDGDALRYAATTSNDSAAQVFVNGSRLDVVAGHRAAKALIAVTATETQGLTDSFSFYVRVGALIRVADAAPVPEGGTATLEVVMARPQSAAITVPFVLRSDDKPRTPDADAGDHGGAGGQVVLAAGQTVASIELPIADDDVIEPAEETFLVSLQPATDDSYALERATGEVVVREGVCDRTRQVRDALRRTARCTEPTVAALADRGALSLEDTGLATLQPDDFLGLAALEFVDLTGNRLVALPPGLFAHTPSLRVANVSSNRLQSLDSAIFAGLAELVALRLDGNRLRELPPGLFAGLARLIELRLDRNPGTPFPLGLTLARIDGPNFAPPPAIVRATVALHAPFVLRSALTLEGGGTASATEFAFAPGTGTSGAVTVTAPAGHGVSLMAAAPPLPTTRCVPGAMPCFQGLRPVAAAPLSLFAAAPTVQGVVANMEVAGGETTRLRLGDVFAVADGSPLRYRVMVEPGLATWRIVDGTLLLTAEETLDEATAVVTVIATGGSGLQASVSFTLTISPTLRGFTRGWRQALGVEENSPGG